MRHIRKSVGAIAFLGAVGASGLVLTAIPSGAKAPGNGSLQAAKVATAKYHSSTQALRDGYSGEHEPCVSSPAGAMGFHYVNGPLVGDPAVAADRPEVLLYLPDADGKLKLVGVEYLVIDQDQDLATDADRPSLFGQAFDGPMEGHAPGMPIHYDLHVWLWADNPTGMFAQFNPALSC